MKHDLSDDRACSDKSLFAIFLYLAIKNLAEQYDSKSYYSYQKLQ